MTRGRLALLLSLLAAALFGLAAGWALGVRLEDSIEQRAHRAIERMRETFRSLTR